MNLKTTRLVGIASMVAVAVLAGCRSSDSGRGFFGRWRVNSGCCGGSTTTVVGDTVVGEPGGCATCGEVPVILPPGQLVTPVPGMFTGPTVIANPTVTVPTQPGGLPPGQIGPAPLPPIPSGTVPTPMPAPAGS